LKHDRVRSGMGDGNELGRNGGMHRSHFKYDAAPSPRYFCLKRFDRNAGISLKGISGDELPLRT
jgi:hypothetical protein